MRKFTVFGLLAAVIMVAGPIALSSLPEPVAEANPGTQWNATYFEGIFGNQRLARIDDRIDFNWGAGSPDPAVPGDNFSARWTKTVNFPTSGTWTFRVGADDGVRMWIDVTPIVDEWHGNPEGYRTYEVPVAALTAGNHDLKVEYFEATGNAGIKVEWFGPGAGGAQPGGEYGPAQWQANYFNNTDLSGSAALSRVDGDINFNWGTGSPGGGVNADNFSARWTTTFNFPQPGRWHFRVGADDGVRMWIDVTQIVNEWHGNPEGFRTYDVDVYALTAGNHELKVEFFEATGNAGVQVRWTFGDAGTGGGGVPQPVPTATPIPPVVVYAAVTGDKVNVRTGPGEGYPVMAQVPFEENYLVLGGTRDLSWLLIDLENGTQGWVSNEWVWLYSTNPEKMKDTTGGGLPDFVDDIPRIDIDIAPPALPPEGPPRVMLTGRATDTLNLRDGASLFGSRIIGSIPQGAEFQVEARSLNGSWYLIDYQDIRGWVSALFVALLDGEVRQLVVSSEVVPAPPPGLVFVPVTEQGQLVIVRGRALSNLRLRDIASLRGTQIGSVPMDAEFIIKGRNTNGAWYLIAFGSEEGWVNAGYVDLIEGTVSDLPIR
jgi:uncharacterized protein YgiM (DUF1202 family)